MLTVWKKCVDVKEIYVKKNNISTILVNNIFKIPLYISLTLIKISIRVIFEEFAMYFRTKFVL